ncbi:MAG: DHH family phosphoesterase [Nitrososphaerota archaeon]|nr:DHH family phosphoesterase [Nitrososphaerota archaeon]
MEDEQGLFEKAITFADIIAGSAKENENILIASHHDADGICSSAIISQLILKNGGHCQIRSVSEPNSRFLDKLYSSKFDLIIFLDICGGLSGEVAKRFGDKWLIIDHHEINTDELESDRVLNSWQFGIDGTSSISTAGLCHYIGKSNLDRSAFLAIVGALSDRQDVGPRRSLVGLNAKIIEADSLGRKSISSKVDMLLWSRETKPIHESLASTLSVHIPGLTGNKDACLASLRSAGIEIKASTRWKTVGELSEDEKQRLIETITPHLSGTTYTVEDLVGTLYSQSEKDEYSSMRDARDLATVLSACGRVGKAGAGIAMCLGESPNITNEVEQAYSDYRSEILRSLQALTSNEDRIAEKGECILVTADGLVGERLTGAICQILASYARFKQKVVFVRTTTSDGDVKISVRAGRDRSDFNLGKIISEIASVASGVGGGFRNAAGARFPIAKQQEFQQAVDSKFQKKLR